MKKRKLSTVLLILIFFVGLSVLLYPTLANYVNAKSQSRAIIEFIEAMSKVDPEQYAAEMEEARAYNKALANNPGRFVMTEQELEKYHHMLGADNTAIGYINIPATRINLPIYLGTEESVLQVGVGCMPGASLPIGGPSTHAILTGHRGLPSSRLFTDLDQVGEGDIFILFVLNEVLTYRVDQIRIVLPQEMDELGITKDKDYCTLVTCTPYGINTHRMLVRGHRVENTEEDTIAARVTADAIVVDPLLVTPAVAAPMLLLLLLFLLIPKKQYTYKNVEEFIDQM